MNKMHNKIYSIHTPLHVSASIYFITKKSEIIIYYSQSRIIFIDLERRFSHLMHFVAFYLLVRPDQITLAHGPGLA